MFGGSRPAGAGLADERVLLRLFVHFHGAKVVLLLGGYDKADAPNERRQQREIGEARRLLGQFKAVSAGRCHSSAGPSADGLDGSWGSAHTGGWR